HQDPQNEFWQLIEAAQGSQEQFRGLMVGFTLDELRAYEEAFFSPALWTLEHYEKIDKIAIDLCAWGAEMRFFAISQGYDVYRAIYQEPEKLTNFNPNQDASQVLYYVINELIKEKMKAFAFDYQEPQNRFWQYIG
ncbi:MAG: hypothetical protein AAF734_09315, partial [Bacteroidota bacterium]